MVQRWKTWLDGGDSNWHSDLGRLSRLYDCGSRLGVCTAATTHEGIIYDKNDGKVDSKERVDEESLAPLDHPLR